MPPRTGPFRSNHKSFVPFSYIDLAGAPHPQQSEQNSPTTASRTEDGRDRPKRQNNKSPISRPAACVKTATAVETKTGAPQTRIQCSEYPISTVTLISNSYFLKAYFRTCKHHHRSPASYYSCSHRRAHTQRDDRDCFSGRSGRRVFVQGARSSGANKRLVVSVPPSYTQPLLFLGIALDTV